MPVADWPWQSRPLPLSLTLSGHCITRPRRRLVSFRAAPSWRPLRYGRCCSWGPSGTPCPARGAPQVTLSCPRAPQIRPFLPTGTHGPLLFTTIFFLMFIGGHGLVRAYPFPRKRLGDDLNGAKESNQVPVLAQRFDRALQTLQVTQLQPGILVANI